MQRYQTTTGSFLEHLASKRRSSGANYARKREAPVQAQATPRRRFLNSSPRLRSHKKITNFLILVERPVL